MTVYEGLTKDMQPDDVDPALTNQGDETMGKGLLRSKTVWFNLLTGAVSIGTFLMNTEFIANNPEVVAVIGTVIAVANIVLRMITKEPIKGI